MNLEKRKGGKAECVRRCSKAELAAMYLNDEIAEDEYFEVIKEQDER